MDTIKKYRIEYASDPKLKPLTVHGVYGGACDNDAIEMQFFTESEVKPKENEIVFDTETGLPLYESSGNNDEITVLQRKVHTRLMMNLNMAKYLIYWLERAIQAIEAKDSEQAPDEENIAKE